MSTMLGFQQRVVPTQQRLKFVNCASQLVMRKKGIHPHLYEKAKVYCKGKHVLTLSGTMEEYHVDIWSGNHPLFTGQKRTADNDGGRLSRFNEKYAGLGDLLEIPTLIQSGNDEPVQEKKKSGQKRKK